MTSIQTLLTTRTLLMIAMLCGIASLTGAVQEARADILPSVGTPTVTDAGGGNSTYSYSILLSSTQNLVAGNSFTIYDFGPALAVATPANWAFSTSAFGPATVNSSTGLITPTQTDRLNRDLHL